MSDEYKLYVGDWFEININQGFRDAEILAVIGHEALIEYHMPKGSTALRVIDRRDPYETEYTPPWERGSISYFRLPKKWSKAMMEAGTHWYGLPQQHDDAKGPVPEPY